MSEIPGSRMILWWYVFQSFFAQISNLNLFGVSQFFNFKFKAAKNDSLLEI